MTIKFNPVVREGTFRADYKDHKRIYTAVDIADAKYQLIDEFDLFANCSTSAKNTILKSIKVWTLRKTIRQSDINRAKRQQKKLDRTSG